MNMKNLHFNAVGDGKMKDVVNINQMKYVDEGSISKEELC